AQTILRQIPADLRSVHGQDAPLHWMADPMTSRPIYAETARALLALSAGTPSLRMLADQSAKVLAGMAHALDGLALLVDAPDRSCRAHRGFRPAVPDWLPAILNGARAFVAIGGVALFWIVTGWPNGASAIFFVMIVVLVLGPRGDAAYGGAIAVALGLTGSIICAAITKFAMLPAFQTFPAFCVILGLFFVPVGFAMARSKQLAAVAIFTTIRPLISRSS